MRKKKYPVSKRQERKQLERSLMYFKLMANALENLPEREKYRVLSALCALNGFESITPAKG